MNAVEVVQHANKAYNAHDADALAAAYAEGATIVILATVRFLPAKKLPTTPKRCGRLIPTLRSS